ncbi:MAG: hypothetical protein NXI08_10780 [bacterium]|nr:hypothetical protein [bacterium]
MKFIKPSEISSKIMTLIEESDEYVIIVSPYVKISKWYKLLKKFDNLSNRNIPVEFIIRDDHTNQASFNELNKLGFRYHAIKDLHCKLYLNEKYAIVSSMNLLLSSEINSLELAYQTETEAELKELTDFCKRYLSIDFSNSSGSNIYGNWYDFVCKSISESIGRNVSIHQKNGSIELNTGTNNYSAFIWNAKHNHLRITGILSVKEYEYLTGNKQFIPEVKGMNIELQKGGKGYYDTIWGTLDFKLRSRDLNNVLEKEKTIISDIIIEFILKIDEYKQWVNRNNL